MSGLGDVAAGVLLLAIVWLLANGAGTAVADGFTVLGNLISSVKLGTATSGPGSART